MLPSQRKALGTLKPSRTLRGAQAFDGLLNPTPYLDQLKAISDRLPQKQGVVIFLPSVGQDIINTQRSHHLAREFTRQGYLAIFDSSNSFDNVSGFKEIEPNLFLFRGPSEVLATIRDPILWTLTYNFDRRDVYPASARTVYDWIDEFEVFNFDRAFLERNHQRALSEATIVLSVARRLHEKAVAERPDALYVPNGVEYEHFAGQSAQVMDRVDIDVSLQSGKPIAGYFGAMAEWFDYELLEAVAGLRSDWNFLLIGPMYDDSFRERGRSMMRRPNIHWIGHREYRNIPAYLHLFDVAIIPFVINNITLATSPLKLYEYFAGGKPVVTTAMPECQAFAEVQIAGDPEEFSRALDIARTQGQDHQFRERLRKLGLENSWASRVQRVLKHL
jgi:glycosyltransferase involved in cell wall biosynthesis